MRSSLLPFPTFKTFQIIDENLPHCGLSSVPSLQSRWLSHTFVISIHWPVILHGYICGGHCRALQCISSLRSRQSSSLSIFIELVKWYFLFYSNVLPQTHDDGIHLPFEHRNCDDVQLGRAMKKKATKTILLINLCGFCFSYCNWLHRNHQHIVNENHSVENLVYIYHPIHIETDMLNMQCYLEIEARN